MLSHGLLVSYRPLVNWPLFVREPVILAPGWIFYGVAAAAGPIVAYCVSQNRVYRGKSEAGAYNPFFYAAAGLSFGNFLLVATMGWLERRAVAAERA